MKTPPLADLLYAASQLRMVHAHMHDQDRLMIVAEWLEHKAKAVAPFRFRFNPPTESTPVPSRT